MSAGTLTLTNNSALVSGAGTSFTTELAAGDFIVVTVGGIPYTLPVKSVESGTALTLVSNYTGPTQSGAAWSAVPRVALNMVTAALVTQSAEALRGLNYDKQNWQSIFSGTGNVTVKLPDNTTWTGPAWGDVAKKGDNSDITSLSGLTTALSIKQGGTGAKNASDALANLGLKEAAKRAVGTGAGQIPDMSAFEYVGNASAGYVKLPNGFKLQWLETGKVPAGTTGVGYWAYPLSVCLFAIAVPVAVTPNPTAGNVVAGAFSNAAVELHNWGPISASARIIGIGR